MTNKVGSKHSKQTSFKSTSSQIPAPFTKAHDSLEPFLNQLEESKVYITHIDRHPREYKQQIFLIPVLLNTAIAALLAWRVYVAAPQYLALTQTFAGYASSATVDTTTTTRKEQTWIVLRRGLMFIADYLVFRFVGTWPLTFFLEQPANPVTWRWKLGFQGKEVVVRVSRGWGREELMKGVKQGEENPFFKTRILPAIERVFMQKTGYLMMGSSWDLEFELMLDAHTLVRQDKVGMEELDKLVVVHQDGTGWLAWRWETGKDVIEERRKKIVAFKERLTAMGKESLFWKWMEVVEDERDADGGFTPERQKKVAARVQREFEKAGVDFEEVSRSIGGLQEVAVKDG